MTEKKSNARILAEQRSELQGQVCNSFKDAGAGAMRSLELTNISEGDTVTIPTDYKIYKTPIAGTEYSAVKVVTEEGKDFFIGCLTRSAQPADGSSRVFPTGTVVERTKNYGSVDEFFDKELRGQKITFTKKTAVKTQMAGEIRTVNVWQIDFK